MSEVTRSQVHAARLAQRKAVCRDAAIKAAIATGQSWDGADKTSAAARDDASRFAVRVQESYDSQQQLRVKPAAENVKAAGEQVASNARQEANLLAKLGTDAIDLCEREEYFALLSEELKAGSSDNQHYSTSLASHHGSTREKLQIVRDRIAQAKKELATVRSQRSSLQAALVDAGDKLAALAV